MNVAETTPDLDRTLADAVQRGRVRLPPYPAVARRIQNIISRADYSMAEVCRAVSADQVLSASVLRLARSPQYRGHTGIRSLDQAVGRVGAETVFQLAVAAGLSAQVSGGALEALRRESWRRSVYAAELCRELAPLYRVDAAEAYVAGLLHDFGVLVGLARLDEALTRWPSNRKVSKSRCRKVALRHHLDLGMMVAARWNLPEAAVEAIRHHHDPVRASNPIVRLVQAADQVVERLEEGLPVVAVLQDSPFPGTARVLLEALLPQLPAIVRELEPRAKVQGAASTVLERIPTTLKAGARAAKFPVMIDGGRYQASRISSDGFEVRGKQPLVEQSIVRATLEAGGESLELWAVVTLHEAGRAIHRLELTPCSLDEETDKRWRALRGHFPPPLPGNLGTGSARKL